MDSKLNNTLITGGILIVMVIVFNYYFRNVWQDEKYVREEDIARLMQREDHKTGISTQDAFSTLVNMSDCSNFTDEKKIIIGYPTHDQSVSKNCHQSFEAITSFGKFGTPKAMPDKLDSSLGMSAIVDASDEENKTRVLDAMGSYYSREKGCDVYH